ncbi:MAG: hypothetical protein RL701_5989 [Pseudomonadota bacterium]|jgi:hypothetical protein
MSASKLIPDVVKLVVRAVLAYLTVSKLKKPKPGPDVKPVTMDDLN